jgi:hypothetical protein
MKTPRKRKSESLKQKQLLSLIKDMLVESVDHILKGIILRFDKLNKKLDVLNEGTDNVIHRQRDIMNKLREHERRIKELENGFLKD